MRKYKFEEESKLISFRVPTSQYKEYRKVIQEFIDIFYFEKVNDTSLLKKLVPYFIKQKVKATLEETEIKRIQKLWNEVRV